MFSLENFYKLDKVISQHKNDKGSLIPVLHEAQKIFGCVSFEVQDHISRGLDIPLSEIYGVVTFYPQFSAEQYGKNIIGVCLGTACYVKGSQHLIDRISEKLSLEPGNTTHDKKFSLVINRCLGACAIAPVMSVNGEVYGKVKPQDIDRILAKYI